MSIWKIMKFHLNDVLWAHIGVKKKKKKRWNVAKKYIYIYIYILIAQHLAKIFWKCWSSTWLWSNDVEMVEMRCHSKDIDINHQLAVNKENSHNYKKWDFGPKHD